MTNKTKYGAVGVLALILAGGTAFYGGVQFEKTRQKPQARFFQGGNEIGDRAAKFKILNL